MLLFIMNHIHWLFFLMFAVSSTNLQLGETTVKNKTLFVVSLLLFFGFFTFQTQFTNNVKVKPYQRDIPVVEQIPLDNKQLQPNLTTEQRQERTEQLLNFQEQFDELLKD